MKKKSNFKLLQNKYYHVSNHGTILKNLEFREIIPNLISVESNFS